MQMCVTSWLFNTLSSCRKIVFGYLVCYYPKEFPHSQTTVVTRSVTMGCVAGGLWKAPARLFSAESVMLRKEVLWLLCISVLYYRVSHIATVCCCNCVQSRQYRVMITKLQLHICANIKMSHNEWSQLKLFWSTIKLVLDRRDFSLRGSFLLRCW